MTENVTNELILEHLKAIQARLKVIENDIADVKTEMRIMKTHIAGLVQSDLRRDDLHSSLQARVERIERRLDLQDG